VGVILSGIVAGALYHQFWQDASTEVARLMPASTRAYLVAKRPWETFRKVLELRRWRDASDLETRLQTSGVFAPGQDVRLYGIALESVWESLPAVDELHLASVPSPEGPTGLVMVQMADEAARGRLLADLDPLLTPVDRRLGYTIEELSQPAVLVPWSEPVVPIHATTLDRYLTLAYGPEAGLDDLLQAKVSGRSQSMRRRGFEAQPPPGELALYLDPGYLYELVGPRGSEAHRAAIVELVRGVTGKAWLSGEEELLEISASLSSGALERLRRALGAGDGRLLDLAPPDFDVAASIQIADPAAFFGELRELALSLSEAADPASPIRPLVELLRDGLQPTTGRLASGELASALAGELLVVRLAPRGVEASPRWLALLEPADAVAAARALEDVLTGLLGPSFAYGAVEEPEQTLYLVRPPEVGAGGELLAFRARGGLLEIAPSVTLLGLASRLSDGAKGARARLSRSLHARGAVYLVARPRLLGELGHPLLARLGEELSAEFRVAASIAVLSDQVELRANLGPWSLLLALAGTDRHTLDAMLLADLPPRCRDALAAMCASRPDAQVCQPLTPGRNALAAGACRRLEARK
jgi:hypothetical protein